MAYGRVMRREDNCVGRRVMGMKGQRERRGDIGSSTVGLVGLANKWCIC